MATLLSAAMLLTVIFAAMPATGSAADASMELTVSLGFGDPQAIDDGTYTTVLIEDAEQWILGDGDPMVPACPVTILLPSNVISIDDVTVTYEGVSAMDGVRMAPSALTTIMGGGEAPTESATYTSVGSYPGIDMDSDMRVHTSDGYRVAHVTLFPVTYTPLNDEVSVSAAAEVTLTVTVGAESAEATGEVPEGALLDEYASTYDVTPSVGVKLLLITSEDLLDDFQSLIDWKTSHGITVVTATTEDIASNNEGADTQERIRDRIIEEHASGVEYVLLGGDDEIIPHRGLYGSVNGGGTVDDDIAGDLYYACLDGDWNDDGDANYGELGEEDLYAEVAIGRAPVASAASVQTFCQKVIDYESSDPGDDALFLGESLDSSTWGGTYKDSVEPYVDGLTIEKMYERDGTFTKSALKSALNEGVHVVNNMGHGNTYIVADLYAYDVESLTNDRTFIWYSQSCYSGSFDNRGTSGSTSSTDCIAEKMVDQEHGAVAFIGNSRYGWYYSGSTSGPSNEYDKMFFDEFEEGRMLGDVFQDSKERKASSSGTYTSYRWIYYELNLLGDPTLMIGGYGNDELEVTITSPTEGEVVPSNVDVEWTFTASELEGTTVSVDGAAPIDVGTASSYGLNDLTVGEHTVIVTVHDIDNNTASDSVTFTVEVDALELTITSPSDGTLTSEDSVTATWDVSSGTASTQVRIDDGAWVTATSQHVFTSLADGAHTISVKATEGTSEVDASVSFTVDTSAPIVSIVSPDDGDVIGGSVTVTWTGSDALSGIASYDVSVDDAAPIDVGTALSYGLSDLTVGEHTVTVTAYDGVGNSASDPVTFTVDDGAPELTITSPSDGSLTSEGSVTVTWEVSDAGSVTTQTRVDDGAWVTATSEHVFTSLADGTHTAYVKATDGTSEVTSSVTFTVDTTAPDVSIVSPDDGDVIGGSVTVTWTGSDALSGIVEYEVNVDGSGWASKGTSTSMALSELSDGDHAIDVRATDAAGNSAIAHVDLIVDATAPTVTITSPDDGSYNPSTVTVVWEVSGASGAEISVDDGAWDDIGPETSYDLSLTHGTHTVVIRATDPVGNTGEDSVSFYVDAVSPTVSITSPEDGSTFSSSVTVRWSAQDADSGIDGQSIKVDSGSWVDMGSATQTTFDSLSSGGHIVTVRATDAVGNTNEDTVSFIIMVPATDLRIIEPQSGLRDSSTVHATWVVDGMGDVACSVSMDGGYWITVTDMDHWFIGLADGDHSLVVRYEGGGTLLTDRVDFTVDTKAPTLSIDDVVQTDSDSVDVSWSAADASGIAGYTVAVDSGTWVDVGTSTSWSFDGLSPGAHEVRVRATDNAGRSIETSTAFEIVHGEVSVDIGSPLEGSFTGDSLVVSWTVSGDVSSYRIELDGDIVGETSSMTYGITDLVDGEHTVTVVAIDGTDVASDTVTFMTDTTAPEVTITAPSNGEEVPYGPVTVVWSCSDAMSGVSESLVSIDDGAWATVGTATSYDCGTLASGEHTIQVRCIDALGNERIAEVGLTVVAYGVEVTITSPEQGALIAGDSVTIAWDLHAEGATAAVEMSVDGAAWYEVTDGAAIVSGLEDGSHTISLRATAGTASAMDEVIVTMDDTAPEITVISPTELVSDGDVRLEWDAYDVNGVVGMWYHPDIDQWMEMPVGGIDLHLSAGSHEIHLRASDSCGNEAIVTIEVEVETDVDGTPPTARIVYPSDGSKIYSRYLNVLVSAQDDQGIASAELYIDGEFVKDMSSTGRAFLWIDGGTHVIRYVVTDVEGLTAYDEVTVNVRSYLMSLASQFLDGEDTLPMMDAGTPIDAQPSGHIALPSMGNGALSIAVAMIATMAAVMVFGYLRR